MPRTPAFALYCRVVDNFGDAGVCWRLARQLATEHGVRVALIIDRPQTLQAIAPRVMTDAWTGRLSVHAWPGPSPESLLAQGVCVAISAFGCELPGPLRRSLGRGPEAAESMLWVNLEYLSAEDWVDGCHGLASTKPSDGAVEHFFYPGFTARTGGLLREHALLARRDAFIADAAGVAAWQHSQGFHRASDERLISLFCYAEAPVAALIARLAAGPARTRVLLPVGVAESAVTDCFGRLPPVGETVCRGALSLQRFALLEQDDYDRLLWSCDLNFVRGEDSWIRAHWAGRPFIWQAYPQSGNTHHEKLDAFLSRLQSAAGTVPEAAAMMRCWNGVLEAGPLDRVWPAFDARIDALGAVCRRWCDQLAQQQDLASQLLEFCLLRL